MGWLAHPLIPLALAAAALMASLALFFSGKRESEEFRRRAEEERKETEVALEALRESVDRLEQELEEERMAACERPRTPQASMNLSKRSQALRMHRLGEPPEKIAQVLGLSRTEVDLLLKVHRMVIASVTEGAGRHTTAGTTGGGGAQPEQGRGAGFQIRG